MAADEVSGAWNPIKCAVKRFRWQIAESCSALETFWHPPAFSLLKNQARGQLSSQSQYVAAVHCMPRSARCASHALSQVVTNRRAWSQHLWLTQQDFINCMTLLSRSYEMHGVINPNTSTKRANKQLGFARRQFIKRQNTLMHVWLGESAWMGKTEFLYFPSSPCFLASLISCISHPHALKTNPDLLQFPFLKRYFSSVQDESHTPFPERANSPVFSWSVFGVLGRLMMLIRGCTKEPAKGCISSVAATGDEAVSDLSESWLSANDTTIREKTSVTHSIS